MGAAEFEGLFYNTLSDNLFKNQIIHIKNSEYDWSISDCLSLHLGIKIGETTTCLSCSQNKEPNILEDGSFILSLD